ncbi:MAG: hypothetical protein ABI231_01300 [Candidatus Tumulicola sp.]
MNFELLDHYLLDGSPAKAHVVRCLLESGPASQAVAPFFEGMRLLGARTPDLTLVALRLVLAGKKADDAAVVELRGLVERARTADASAREAYRALLGLTASEGAP